jgi:hypothetical protein
MAGSKINKGHGTGGFDSSASDNGKGTSRQQLWVTRKTAFAAFLKRGVSAFISGGSVVTQTLLHSVRIYCANAKHGNSGVYPL